jgi:hypothetical protein
MRSLLAILVFSSLTGCATHPPASSCDGSQRRPVNNTSHAGLHFQSCGVEVA